MLRLQRYLAIIAMLAVSAPLLADEFADLNIKLRALYTQGKFADASAVAQEAASKALEKFGENSMQYAEALS